AGPISDRSLRLPVRCLWSVGGVAEVGAGRVEGGAELVGVAADLGEEEAALDAGHGGGGERGGVGARLELAAGLHSSEAVADVCNRVGPDSPEQSQIRLDCSVQEGRSSDERLRSRSISTRVSAISRPLFGASWRRR